MNRGRARNVGRNSSSTRGRSSGSGSGGNSAHRRGPIGADGSSSGAPFGNKDRSSVPGRQTSGQMPEAVGCSAKQLESLSASSYEFQKDFPSLSAQSSPRDKHLNARRTQRGQTLDLEAGGIGTLHFDRSPVVETACMRDEPSMLAESGIKDRFSEKGSQCEQTSHENTANSGNSKNSECLPVGIPYDICQPQNESLVTLKAPLLTKNREKRNELKRSLEGKNITILRSGMVLLKRYISCNDQVMIVKICSKIGVGAGGAIQDSHAWLKKESKSYNVEDILPSMSPNICIVNFYTKSGRLGLHQDKDESQKSLLERLPVVSFSIGDSAEFLYADQRDTEKPEKIILESGDVLIFGGESRHIFHGVKAILPDTAPKTLLTETGLRPGRLNLTFREY
ncbi:hypothetical protein F0562_024212 [Nyssa sinensis]|uniref:Fe2OG dioxygenase domain-containing protein n=1 Tax=Nyssa sinensis TaxID=561372 RepID=A0A5J5BAK9_9ASTE|nr:hypothetical protein F0562_024212 [Nyssa sinensis]